MMFATAAQAQTTAPAAGGGGAQDLLLQMAPLLVLFVLFYFLLIRPQQRRMKAHREMVAGVKRGDTVVLSSGIVGRVTGVGETEVTVEIAPNTPVKVVKGMIGEVRTRGEPAAANDTKLVK
jgi:preprotein translocase subunit YajC